MAKQIKIWRFVNCSILIKKVINIKVRKMSFFVLTVLVWIKFS